MPAAGVLATGKAGHALGAGGRHRVRNLLSASRHDDRRKIRDEAERRRQAPSDQSCPVQVALDVDVKVHPSLPRAVEDLSGEDVDLPGRLSKDAAVVRVDRETRRETTMKQYLLSIYQPDGDPPPPDVLEPIMTALGELNEEMKRAGAWVFTAGLHPASSATVIRSRDGEPVLTDGPFTEGKEHLGGFTVINAPDLDAALEWGGRMASILSMLAVEVRPLA
jgi:hypothetical protein